MKTYSEFLIEKGEWKGQSFSFKSGYFDGYVDRKVRKFVKKFNIKSDNPILRPGYESWDKYKRERNPKYGYDEYVKGYWLAFRDWRYPGNKPRGDNRKGMRKYGKRPNGNLYIMADDGTPLLKKRKKK